MDHIDSAAAMDGEKNASRLDNVKNDRMMTTSKTQQKGITESRTLFFNDRSKKSFFGPGTLQPKLTIGAPNDKYEREAEAMAEKVVNNKVDGLNPMQSGTGVQRMCSDCEEEHSIQRMEKEEDKMVQTKPLLQLKADGGGIGAPALSSQLNSTKGGGGPLPKQVNENMGRSFGTDFSGVRVHTDGQAVQMSQGLQARAFTYGSDIYFNQGEYSPGTQNGERLLAHELTHVVQQGEGKQGAVQRMVIASNVSCNQNGLRNPDMTGAEVVAAIGSAVDDAITLAARVENLLFLERVLAEAGGPVDANLDRILQEELDLTLTNAAHFRLIEQVETRFERVRTTLESGILRYMCRGGTVSLQGCLQGSCDAGTFAFTCPGNRLIILCQRFWNEPNERPQTILHEVFHILFHMPHTNRLKRANTFCLESLALRLAGQNAPQSCA